MTQIRESLAAFLSELPFAERLIIGTLGGGEPDWGWITPEDAEKSVLEGKALTRRDHGFRTPDSEELGRHPRMDFAITSVVFLFVTVEKEDFHITVKVLPAGAGVEDPSGEEETFTIAELREYLNSLR